MRKYLVAVSAAFAVTAFLTVGVAYGASSNTASLDAKFNPDTASATSFTKGGLFVETSTLFNTDPGSATSPTLEPSPTTHVTLDFDKNLKFATGAVKVCNNGLAGTTQQGMKACGDSYVGGGYATICASAGGPGTACGTGLPANTGVFNATVSAYNGPKTGDPGGNKPTIKLQAVADHTPLGPTTVPLTGTLKGSSAGAAFNKALDVPVPSLGGGLAAITDFSVNVNNAGFVSAKCNGDNAWDFHSTATDSGGSLQNNVSEPCTQG